MMYGSRLNQSSHLSDWHMPPFGIQTLITEFQKWLQLWSSRSSVKFHSNHSVNTPSTLPIELAESSSICPSYLLHNAETVSDLVIIPCDANNSRPTCSVL